MRKTLIVIFCILGYVIGMALGQLATGVNFLSWLNLGGEFGLVDPVILNLGFIKLTLGFWCKVSVAGIIGMIGLALISKKVLDWLKI